MQLKTEKHLDIIVEWIPYDQFDNIKKTSKDGFATAIWKDGLLEYNREERKRKRTPNKEVTLKYLINSQNVINEFSNEAKAYSIKEYNHIPKIYGISQNPATNNYIIVLENSCCKECGEIYMEIWSKWCRPCQINNLELNHSGNKKIDEFIQEMQLKIESVRDIIVEWIPYDQFNIIKEISKDNFARIYLAIWKVGPLECNYDEEKCKHKRKPNKEVTLKCLNNSQNVISDLLNEAKTYSIKDSFGLNNTLKIYGISQNPDTKDYIIVLDSFCENCGEIYTNTYYRWCKPCHLIQNFANWTSGNEKIDEFIQEMQLKIESVRDIIVEWIPYDQFNIIKEISKDNFARIYLAIWKDGPLEYNYFYRYNYHGEKYKYERQPNKEVILKYSNNSQSAINDFLNEAKAYSIKGKYHICDIPKIYGISQNPNTSEYIIVFKDGHYCKNCGEIYHTEIYKKLKRTTPNKEVALKCLHNSQNITNEFLNEINAYSISIDNGILRICGISQNPDTNNYIIVLEYANGGNLDNYNNNIIRNYNWVGKLSLLRDIVKGLKKIHENEVVHRDFHTGNILISFILNSYDGSGNSSSNIYISDMGLCGEVSNIDKTKIYGVMPFVAPEVLRGKPYTQAADVYSFDPDKRPSAIEIKKLVDSFPEDDYDDDGDEIKKQIKEAEEYRKTHFLFTGNSQSIHPQACYTSRLLNPFTKDLSNDTDCLDCMIND
ncbi:uncharacterized protein OCT59_005849 [Rhizophagus irregularis]|uniref:uncharacterized protein n=1 Tax=Rhizophagus irregularis TaxID=588596 RepID=UPI0033246545|nr:hypothetical protein OCT59_005849 [Rhizophagus irregularis]